MGRIGGELQARSEPESRVAIAAYVEALPRLVELGHADATRVERALRDYWRRFLPGRPELQEGSGA
jgi:hypothetical protein